MIQHIPSGPGRIIAAIDTTDLTQAQNLAQRIAPHIGMIKLGLEFFNTHGQAGVRQVAQGNPFFLDLKLHDIPNTVAGAVRAVLPCMPSMLTIHASGGGAMIAAARKAAEEAGTTRPILLAVTVLTSIDAATLASIGITGTTEQQVLRLARIALEHGADGLVCSAHEAGALRAAFGTAPALIVPGIRPAGSDAADQKRTMEPAAAIAAGADWLVIGRPITQAPDPAAAAAAIAAALS